MVQKNPGKILPRLGLAVCSSLLGDLALFAVLATQTQQTGLGLAQIGILLSVHRFIRLPANPLAGLLVDRWGRRRVFLTGMVLAVLSTAGYGFSSGFWFFLLCRLLWGVAWSMINTGGLNILLDLSTPDNRGRFSGIYNAWVWAGYALGPSIGGLLVDTIQFRPAMACLAGLTGLGLIAALWGLPETRLMRKEPIGQVVQYPVKLSTRLGCLARNPHLWLSFILYALTRFTGDGIILSTLALLLTQRFGGDILVGDRVIGVATLSGITLAVFSVLAGAAGGPAGKISDGKWGRLAVIFASLGLGTIGFILLGFVHALWGLVVGVLLSAIGGGGVVAALTAYMGDQTTFEEQGMLMGMFSTAGDVGSMLGPLIALSLASSIHLENVYLISIGVYGLGMIMVGIRMKLDTTHRVQEGIP